MTEQDINEFIAPKGLLRNIPKGAKLIYKAHEEALIDAKIEEIEWTKTLFTDDSYWWFYNQAVRRIAQLKKEKNKWITMK